MTLRRRQREPTTKSAITPLAALLPGVLREVEAAHKPLQLIRQRWGRLVSKALRTHTRPVSLRRGRLVVQADRPGDSYALAFERPRLIKRLQALTEGRVEELIVRPGGKAAA